MLLFDEPLSNLDAKLREQMRLEIRASAAAARNNELVCNALIKIEAMAISDRIVILKDGCIEQSGTPEEVYTRPSNHFVADFIGRANFVSGHVVAAANGGYNLEVSGRTVYVPAAGQESFAPGDFADILLRPENTYVLRKGAEPAGAGPGDLMPVVDGRLVRRTFLGSVVEYEIEVPGHPRILAEMANPFATGILDPGDEVTVYFSPQSRPLARGVRRTGLGGTCGL